MGHFRIPSGSYRRQRSPHPISAARASGSDPYVSLVIVGRNDGYGDDFLGRLRRFMASLDHQVAPYPGLIEVVFVEWNPRPQDLPMSDVMPRVRNFDTRIVTVPADVHDGLDPHLPVLEWHGKNTGARRARGQFVLLTNPDILFSSELIDRLAQRDLDPDRFYRTDRYDFRGINLDHWPVAEWIDEAANHVFAGYITIRSMSTEVEIRVAPGAHVPRDRLPASREWKGFVHSNGSGDFILAHRLTFDEVGGMWEQTQQRWHVDTYSVCRMFVAGFDCEVFTAPACIFHQDHARADADRVINQTDANEGMLEPGTPDWGLAGHHLPEQEIERIE